MQSQIKPDDVSIGFDRNVVGVDDEENGPVVELEPPLLPWRSIGVGRGHVNCKQPAPTTKKKRSKKLD